MDWLLDTVNFVPRGSVGAGWTSSLIYAYKFANLVIACSYLSIPVTMIVFWHKRRNNLSHSWVVVLIAVFISMTGLMHLDDILVFYWPAYRFFTIMCCLTAGVAFFTACMLPAVMLHILKLPSRESIHRINGELNKIVLEQHLRQDMLEQRNKTLIEKITILESMLETNQWVNDKATALKELREMLLTVESTSSRTPEIGS